jgi:hypothetical protein
MNIHELEQDLGWILTQIEDTDKQDKNAVEIFYQEKVQDILNKMADLEGISNG